MEVMPFGHEYHRSDGVSFSVHHFRGYTKSIYLMISDVTLEHLAKVMSIRLPYHKITVFFLCN